MYGSSGKNSDVSGKIEEHFDEDRQIVSFSGFYKTYADGVGLRTTS